MYAARSRFGPGVGTLDRVTTGEGVTSALVTLGWLRGWLRAGFTPRAVSVAARIARAVDDLEMFTSNRIMAAPQ
jgi:hypothetical protein